MKVQVQARSSLLWCFTLSLILVLTTSCASRSSDEQEVTADRVVVEQENGGLVPVLAAASLAGDEQLQVVASTNIVADVVSQVGGDRIDLVGLIPAGVDPHGYEPTPQDLIALNDAHVIFINGLGLEEPLDAILDSFDGDGTIVSVNTGVKTLEIDEEEEHGHSGADPHTWFSIRAVEQWVENVEQVLSDLDPANAEAYVANAEAYLTKLGALETHLADMAAELAPAQRKLVTDHDSLGYLAEEYDFEIVGTVIPGLSTMAAPSAAQLATLHDQILAEEVKAIFVGASANPSLVEQLANDVGVQIATVYTGSLSDPTGPAGTYLDFMRYNMTTIVEALK